MISLQYYQRPFLLFYEDIAEEIKTDSRYLRKSFWNLIPSGEYAYLGAQELYRQYAKSLERKASKIISKYSIAYWLHLSRRIGLGSGGTNKESVTININRFNILALVQRYGQKNLCGSLSNSKQIDVSEIFNGLLLSDEFELERKLIDELPAQLVLTDFTSRNLLEYYNLENICYELWVCGAKLRSIAKGATITVDHNSKDIFYENPDDKLDRLIASYDSRLGTGFTSETGTVFSNEKFDTNSEIFLPVLNSSHISGKHLSQLTEQFLNIKLGDQPTNFIIYPYPLKKYITALLPFDNDFKSIFGISYINIVLLLASMCFRYFYMTIVEKRPILINILMRGYEGPSTKAEIVGEIMYFMPHTLEILKGDNPERNDIEKAFEFLELKNQESIDFEDFGTLKVFCPVGDNRYYVDYSVIPNILYSLFNQIDLNPHNFRGEILENSIGFNSYLKTTKLKHKDGSSRQIDFSYLFGDLLIIAECKVVARKPSYFSGSFKSLILRQEKLIEKGLKQVDDKAEWLLERKKGTNYDTENVKYILPVVISPFVEYISSVEHRYWINDELPRALSLEEFRKLLNEFDKDKVLFNLKYR